VTEPTDLQIGIGHKGFAWLEVETRGRAAHGSRPKDGRDAILRMGRVLARLERRRLIRRTADPSDRRRVHLALTVRGAAIDRLRDGTAEVLVRNALRRASAGARAGARDVLTRVAEVLDDSGEDRRPRARKAAVGRRGGVSR